MMKANLWKSVVLGTMLALGSTWAIASSIDINNKKEVAEFWQLEGIKEDTLSKLYYIVDSNKVLNAQKSNNKFKITVGWQDEFTPEYFWIKKNWEKWNVTPLNRDNYKNKIHKLGLENDRQIKRILLSGKAKYEPMIDNILKVYNEGLTHMKNPSQDELKALLASSSSLGTYAYTVWGKNIWCSIDSVKYLSLTNQLDKAFHMEHTEGWMNNDLLGLGDINDILSIRWLKTKKNKIVSPQTSFNHCEKEIIETSKDSLLYGLADIETEVEIKKLEESIKKLDKSNKESAEELIMFITIMTESRLEVPWPKEKLHNVAIWMYYVISQKHLEEHKTPFYKEYTTRIWNKYKAKYPSQAKQIEWGVEDIKNLKY